MSHPHSSSANPTCSGRAHPVLSCLESGLGICAFLSMNVTSTLFLRKQFSNPHAGESPSSTKVVWTRYICACLSLEVCRFYGVLQEYNSTILLWQNLKFLGMKSERHQSSRHIFPPNHHLLTLKTKYYVPIYRQVRIGIVEKRMKCEEFDRVVMGVADRHVVCYSESTGRRQSLSVSKMKVGQAFLQNQM